MMIIGVVLIVIGVVGIILGMMMFGDIGIACIIGALAALLAGVGFIIARREISRCAQLDGDGKGSIPSTDNNALPIILTVAVIVAIALLWGVLSNSLGGNVI